MDSQNTSEENLIDELTALREQKAELQAEIDRLRNSSQRFKIRNEVLELKVAERTAQLEAQVEQVTAVNMIMQMVASGRDLPNTLEIVAQEMCKLFNATSCGIALINAERTSMKVVTSYTPDPDLPKAVGLEISLDSNLAIVDVVETGEAIIIDDPQTNPLTESLHEFLRGRNAQCMMILPLLARGRVIGTIGIENDEPGRRFSPDEILLAEMVGIQISGLIERAKMTDEDLQKAYEQLQAMDKLKSAFIGVITHELRSPFVAASLSAELLKRYVDKQMYDELQNQIGELNRELAEGRKMIDHVISYAELMNRQSELRVEETDFEELTESAIQPLIEVANTRQITIVFSFDQQMPPVQVDREKMGEAIYHLVHNAIKFNQEGGRVRIRCKRSNSHLILKVRDTGQGLPPEQLNSIWEAFAQTADDLKRGVEGLGLGLALVKYVVNAHGGQVAATSRQGQGSVFGFTIPLEQ